MKSLLCTAILTLSSFSFAGVLNTIAGEKKIAEVAIAKSATFSQRDEKAELTLIGAGLRTKKVLFVNVKVYVGQLFVNRPASFEKSDALNSLANQTSLAMQLTFLRDVDAEKIKASFDESFKINNVDTKEATISKLLTAVHEGGEVKSQKTITVIAIKKDKIDTIFVELPNGQVVETSGEGLTRKVFSLWFGTAADSGVEALKNEILK